MKKATLKEVATLAGTSITTASAVLSKAQNYERFSVETIERVEQAAAQLNYRSNYFAKALRQQQTFQIGLVIPNMSHPFMPLLIRGTGDIARSLGYNLLLIDMTDLSKQKSVKFIRNLIDSSVVDGLIVHAMANELAASVQDIKTVYIDEHKTSPAVTFAADQAAYELTEMFIGQGHEDIAFINGDLPIDTYKFREIGYKKALKDNGISFHSDFVYRTSATLQGGIEAFEWLRALPKKPSAIITFTDVVAHSLLMRMLSFGIKVPDDIAVASIDDVELSAQLIPSLTSIKVDAEEIGRRAAKILIDMINGKDMQGIVETVPTQLIIRQSSHKT